MPVMDGFTATRRLRESPRFQALPILAMTANAMAGDHEKCIENGMNDHVAKPIDPDLLFMALTTWIPPGIRVPPDVQTSRSAPVPLNTDWWAEDLPGIDTALACKRIGDDPILLHNILTTFLQDHTNDVATLRRALDANDMPLAKRIAHTLKGVAGSIGATDLQLAATALDTAFSKGETAAHAHLLNALESALDLVSNSLSRLRARVAAEKVAEIASLPMDAQLVASLLEKVSRLLRELDPEAETAANALRQHITAGPAQPLVNDLVEQLANFDFDTADQTLERLKEMLKNLS